MAGAMRWAVLGACILISAVSLAAGGTNLVVNGGFDNPDNPLYGWKYKYDLPGESFSFQNHEHVKVVPNEGGHGNALSLWGNEDILNGAGQGTKVDSEPIPVKPNGKYRVSASARSAGPDARILVECYRWRPGIKPHANPELHELRKCYKSPLVFFGARVGGETSGVFPGRGWERGSQTFPNVEHSKEGQEAWAQVQFLVIHIVAIEGSEGTLYVDDVELTRLN